jgi:hypothetical protein
MTELFSPWPSANLNLDGEYTAKRVRTAVEAVVPQLPGFKGLQVRDTPAYPHRAGFTCIALIDTSYRPNEGDTRTLRLGITSMTGNRDGCSTIRADIYFEETPIGDDPLIREDDAAQLVTSLTEQVAVWLRSSTT